MNIKLIYLLSSTLMLTPLNALTCKDYECLIGSYTLHSDNLITESQESDTISSYSASGTFSISDENTTLLQVTNSQFDLFTSYECSDENCSDFTPASDSIYLSKDTNATESVMRIESLLTGHTITSSSISKDLSNSEYISIGLAGSIKVSHKDSAEFAMTGRLDFDIDKTAIYPQAFSITYLGDDGKIVTPQTQTCQEATDNKRISISLGNIKIAAKKACIEDKNLYFYNNASSSVYIQALNSDDESYAIKLPSYYSSLAVDFNALNREIPVEHKLLTLRDGLALKAESLCINPKADGSDNDKYIIAGSCDGFDTSLTIAQREFSDANAKIEIHDGVIENIYFKTASTLAQLMPSRAKSSNWFATFIDKDLYLASENRVIYDVENDVNRSVSYGFMIDTQDSDTQNYSYKTEKGIKVDIDAGSDFNTPQSIQNPKTVHSLQIRYALLRGPIHDEKTDVGGHNTADTSTSRFVIHLNDDKYTSLQIDDSSGNFLDNYNYALSKIGKAYYDIGGNRSILLEGSWSRSKAVNDAKEYLFSSLDLKNIENLQIANDGAVSTSSKSAKTEYYKIDADKISFDSAELKLPSNFTLTHLKSNSRVNIKVDNEIAELQINSSDYRIKGSGIKVDNDGKVYLENNTSFVYSDGSELSVGVPVEVDLNKNTLTIYPDSNSIVSLSTQNILLDKPLVFSLDNLKVGKFSGAITIGSDKRNSFNFEGEGSYNIKDIQIESIDIINSHALKDSRYEMSSYLKAVFLGSVGIWSDSVNHQNFNNGVISTDLGDFHFARKAKDSEHIDFKITNVKITIDPKQNKITAIEAGPSRGGHIQTPPVLHYVSPSGHTFEMTGSNIDLIQHENGVDIIELKAPVTIHESDKSYTIDGNVSIDYMNRRIIRISPKPGTGLVLNENTAIYSDSNDIEIDDKGILHVNGKIDIGEAKIANECASEQNCISFNGSLTYDTVLHKFVNITTDGSLSIPHPDKMTLSVNSLTSVKGSPYFKVDDKEIVITDDISNESVKVDTIVVDIDNKKIVASKMDNSYIWIIDDKSFGINDGILSSSGKVAITADNQIPTAFNTSLQNSSDNTTDESNIDNIITTASVNTEAKTIDIEDGKISYGHYDIFTDGGTFTQYTSDDGREYYKVTKPLIYVMVDKNSEYNYYEEELERYEDAEALISYDHAIYVGKTKNMISSVEYSANEDNETIEHYVVIKDVARFPGEYEDINLSKLNFNIPSDDNVIEFEKSEENSYDEFLPQISFPSLYMVMGQTGSSVHFELFKDKVEAESKLSYFGGEFFGLFTAGKSANIIDLLGKALVFLDIEADPKIVLSQVQGESHAKQHYGIRNIMKMFDSGSESGISWTSYIKSTEQPNDVIAVDLDFVSETFGGYVQLPISLMGDMYKAKNPSEEDGSIYLGMWFQPYMKDGKKHVMLNKLSGTISRDLPPLFLLPPEPAGLAINWINLSIEGFSSIASDEEGTLKVATKCIAEMEDGAEVLKTIEKVIGIPFIEFEEAGILEFNKEEFKVTLTGEALLLRSYVMQETTESITASRHPEFSFESKFDFIVVGLNAEVEVKLDKGLHVDASGKANIKIPDLIPVIGGNDILGEEVFMKWIIQSDEIEEGMLGATIDTQITKNWSLTFDYILELFPHPKAYIHKRSAKIAPEVSVYLGESKKINLPKTRSLSAPISINIAKSAQTVIIKLSAEDTAPKFDVTFPDSSYYRQVDNSDINSSSNNLNRLLFETKEDAKTTYLMLHNPDKGEYSLHVNNALKSGAIRAEVIYAPNKIEATLSVLDIPLRSNNRRLSLDINGIDNNATVTFYATKKRKINLGHRISEPQIIANGEYNFDISTNHDKLHSGFYHVYAKIQRENSLARFIWLDDMMEFHNELSPDIARDIEIALEQNRVKLSWSQDATDIKHHWIHVYKAGDTKVLHSHFYKASESEFYIDGLDADTEYDMRIESVNSNLITSHSKLLRFKTDDTFIGSADLVIDTMSTKENFKNNLLSVTVCNRGSADSEGAVMDIYYKMILPQTMVDDHPVDNISAGECKDINISINEDVINYVREHYPQEKESLYIHLDKTQPYEYETDNNSAYIVLDKSIFPLLTKARIHLNRGWNFISLPVHVTDFKSYNLHGVDKILSYSKYDGWSLNPETLQSNRGYWIKATYESEIELEGYSYKPNYTNKTSGWYLLGAGEDIHNGVDDIHVKMIWLMRDSKWYKNPELIRAGEAYWAEIE